MTTLEQIQQLIEELGPATTEVEAVQQSDDASWEAAFADDNIIQIQFVEGPQKLVFTADLGPLPPENQAASLAGLMVYNGAWAVSGGLRMGLDAPDGSVLLMFDIGTTDLSLQTLQDYLSAFAGQAAAWRVIVAVGFGGDAASADADTGAVELAGLPAGIRV